MQDLMVEERTLACVHRWVLAQPAQGSVSGECRRCGARRTYPAGIDLPPPADDEEPELDADAPALAKEILSMDRRVLV
jgi:hypothetical protein